MIGRLASTLRTTEDDTHAGNAGHWRYDRSEAVPAVRSGLFLETGD